MSTLQELSKRIVLAAHELAEALASEFNDTKRGEVLEIITLNPEDESKGCTVTLLVDVIVSNYKYEEETNSAEYNVEIICTKINIFPERLKLLRYLKFELLNETLYKD